MAKPLDPNNVAQCRQLLLSQSIWIDPAVYEIMPVLYPHLMRDSKTKADTRGTPHQQLYAKDENTALKDTPGLLVTKSPNPLLAKWERGGWYANHIAPTRWFERCRTNGSNEANMYSFIPNLVWLPWAYKHYTDFPSCGDASRERLPRFNEYLYSFSRFLYENKVPQGHPNYKLCDGLWCWLETTISLGSIHSASSSPKSRGIFPAQWQQWHQIDQHRVTYYDPNRFFNSYLGHDPAVTSLLRKTRSYVSVLTSKGAMSSQRSTEKSKRERASLERFAKGIKTRCRNSTDCKKVAQFARRLERYCERCERIFLRSPHRICSAKGKA